MAWFIEGGIWIGSVNIDIQTSMFVLEKKISQYCNFFLHFIQNRPLSDISTIWQITGFSASYCSNIEINLITKKKLCFSAAKSCFSSKNLGGILDHTKRARPPSIKCKPFACKCLIIRTFYPLLDECI